jgi:stage III sporulation protein AC
VAFTDISIVIKIAAVGIIVAILNSILVRTGRDDYALITILAGIVAVLMMLVPQFAALLDTVKSIVDF